MKLDCQYGTRSVYGHLTAQTHLLKKSFLPDLSRQPRRRGGAAWKWFIHRNSQKNRSPMVIEIIVIRGCVMVFVLCAKMVSITPHEEFMSILV